MRKQTLPTSDSLINLQEQLQNFLLDKSEELPSITLETPRFKRKDRLDIYYHAYRLRLIEALGKDFPALEKWMGSDAFSDLCLDYVAQYPSNDPSLRWLSRHFVDFLVQRDQEQIIIDLAKFEWAQIMAFDAAESNLIDDSALKKLAPQEWMTIKLKFHESVQLIYLRTPAPRVWQSLEKDLQMSDQKLGGLMAGQAWVVWRKELTILFQPCDPLEAEALRYFQADLNLQEVFEQLAESNLAGDFNQLPQQIAGFLRRWIQQGWITSLDQQIPAHN